MDKREISNRRRTWLEREIEVWRDESLLSPEQGTQILSLYKTSADLAARNRNLALFTLMGMAAFLVGLAVLLLVGYNWAAISSPLKIAIIFAAILGAHAVGFHLRYGKNARMLSEVAFFLGCLFFGAGLFLVARIFHLDVYYPSVVWWWAIGVLAFAICLNSLLIHLLLAGLLAIWCGMEIIGFGDLGVWFFRHWNILPNGAYTLPLLAAPGFLWAYKRKSLPTVWLYVVLLAWWVVLQPFAWQAKTEAVFFIGAVGGLLLVIAESHKIDSQLAIPYRVCGIVLSAGVLVPLSFYRFCNEVLRHGSSSIGLPMQTVAIIVLSVAVIGLSALARSRDIDGKRRLVEEVDSLVSRAALPLVLVLTMAFLSLWTTITDDSLLPVILANITMVGLSIWLLWIGLRNDSGLPFTTGVFYFLLWTVLRYVDLFGDFGGMPGAALMFSLCGALLFGVAVYWRRRKG